MNYRILEIKWNKTREVLPEENSDENYAFITESRIIRHGYYANGFFYNGDTNFKYNLKEVVYWILEDDLCPKGFDVEQKYRTNNKLNH